MATLFGGSKTTPTPPTSTLRVQTSLEGKARSLVYGTTRIAGNLFWYGDFYSVTASSGGAAGGKGGVFSTGSAAGGSYYYYASVELGIADGPLSAIGPKMWASKALTTLADNNLAAFLGTDSQVAWSYLTAQHPDQALSYRLTAYIAGNVSLGSNAELPNWTFEVTGAVANAAPGIVDANPTAMLADFLANPDHGVPGWLADYNGDWSIAGGYFLATGLLVSYALSDQTTAATLMDDFLTSLNVIPVWSDTVLSLVPRGDQQIVAGAVSATKTTVSVPDTPDDPVPYSLQMATGGTFVQDQGVIYTGTGLALIATPFLSALSEGEYSVSPSGLYAFSAADDGVSVDISFTSSALASYNPPTRPIYDLDDSDYLENQSSFGTTSGDPVSGQRLEPRDQNNVIKVEYLDRSADYNVASIKAQNDSSVLLYGERASKGVQTWHWFQVASAATMAAALALGREKIANLYSFTVRPRFIGLNPADIITITDPALNLARQWVRVREITENADRSLSILAEEYLEGTAAAPLYGKEASTGFKPDYNADPGPTNAPIIFEPTDQTPPGGLQICAAVSGTNPTLYGGCDAWVSYDGVNYSFVPGGRIYGAARMGVLSAPLPMFAPSLTGATIDTTNTLSVDLTESAGDLAAATTQDAIALNTALWIGGEIVSYATASLTAAFKYDLSYLVRGGYGTESSIAAHATGTPFARLDSGVLSIPYDQTRIGSTIYLKFLPFNIWGGGERTLDQCPAYPYKITGAALASPLPTVANLRSAFTDGFQELVWDEVSDFRTSIRYKIYVGDTFAGAQQRGDVAHPPFKLLGNGTYWVIAYCSPAPGLVVTSELPASISISGNMLVSSIVFASDQQAAGWPGQFTNTAIEGSGAGAILRLVGAENVLTDSSILTNPDLLNAGGVVASGSYEISPKDWINVGYVADIYVNVSWKTVGVPVGQNILSLSDFLNAPDILGSASTQFVDGWVEIATAQSASSDAFAPSDAFSLPDIFTADITWSDWQKYVPGVYRAMIVKLRLVLATIDGKTVAYDLAFSFTGSVKPRIDHYQGMTVPSTGVTVPFEPDDGTAPAPFNGGPLVGGTNNHPLPFVSFDWQGSPGDKQVIDSLTLSQLVFHIVDINGNPVTRTGVNVTVEGY